MLGGVTYVPDRASPYAEFDAEHAAGIRMLAVRPRCRARGSARPSPSSASAGPGPRAQASSSSTRGLSMKAAHHMYEKLGFERDPNLDWWPTPGIELLGYRMHLDRSA
jgi:hypothetical protein